MSLVASFTALLQPLALVMTQPSFHNAVTLLTGWVFAPKRTVTNMIAAAGVVREKHFSAFHRFFAEAPWSLDAIGLIVFDLATPWLGTSGSLDEPIFLAVDDTLARKRGLKVFGVGMHHDPLLSSRPKAITNWGHSWVVLGVIVRFPLWPERAFCLPILFRLYLNHEAAARHRRVHRTRPELAVELLQLLCNARKNRRFHLVADSGYGGQSVLNHRPENCDLTSRLLLNSRLYEAPPERLPGTHGRPRRRGVRLPTPGQMLDGQTGRARRIDLNMYGRCDRVRLCETVAFLYSAPTTPLRVVAVEPLVGGRGRQAFYSTRPDQSGVEVLVAYSRRWSAEIAQPYCLSSERWGGLADGRAALIASDKKSTAPDACPAFSVVPDGPDSPSRAEGRATREVEPTRRRRPRSHDDHRRRGERSASRLAANVEPCRG